MEKLPETLLIYPTKYKKIVVVYRIIVQKINGSNLIKKKYFVSTGK